MLTYLDVYRIKLAQMEAYHIAKADRFMYRNCEMTEYNKEQVCRLQRDSAIKYRRCRQMMGIE